MGHGAVQVERDELDKVLVERTFDYPAIAKMATHSRIYHSVADDYSPRAEEWEPVQNDSIFYLMGFKAKWPIGFAAFMPRTGICYEGHFGFIPQAWGKTALDCAIAMTRWMWDNTPAMRLCGEIAGNNKLALNLVLRAGWEAYGVNERSWQKDGVIYDRICVGVTRPQWA